MIEIREGVYVKFFIEKKDFQIEIIQNLFTGSTYTIRFCGLIEDMSFKDKSKLWNRNINKLIKDKDRNEKGIVKRFQKLVDDNGSPKYIIIYWKKKTHKSLVCVDEFQ
jgi:hypothetical protein